MISAMPAVAVRRERKKQQRAAAAAASRTNSLSSLGTNSTRSTSLSSTPSTPHAPPNLSHPYYNYYMSRRAPSPSTASLNLRRGSQDGSGGPKRSGSNPSVSTITSTATSYVSALHRVRERQLDVQRERARFILYTGSVLLAAGLALIFIGLAISVSSAQNIGLLFVASGSLFCLARYFCFGVDQIPLVKKARTVSGQSIYSGGQSLMPSTATTPGTDDSSTISSYYFSAVPLHRAPLSPSSSSQQDNTPVTPTGSSSSAAGAVVSIPPPLTLMHGGSSGGGGSMHRDRHSIRSNASSILTPMSLDSIPEMQVLITDDSQRYWKNDASFCGEEEESQLQAEYNGRHVLETHAFSNSPCDEIRQKHTNPRATCTSFEEKIQSSNLQTT